MRILVTGGRGYRDTETVKRVLAAYDDVPRPTLVHGDASGADRECAYVAAYLLEWRVECWPAEWRRLGRRAGPARNQAMVDSGGDVLVAFPGGRGTADMVRRAEEAGIPVYRVAPGAEPREPRAREDRRDEKRDP